MLGHQQRLGKPRHPRVPSVSHRAAQVMDGYAATRALRALGFRGLIIGVWCVYALVYVGFGLANQPWHIWALFIAYGLFYGMTESTERALVADFYPDAQRGRAFGSFNFITGIGALPASLLMGWLWTVHGPLVAFGTGGAFALCAVVWFGFKVPHAR